MLRRKRSQNGGRSKQWLEKKQRNEKHTINVMATVCSSRVKEGEMTGHVARMGIKERT